MTQHIIQIDTDTIDWLMLRRQKLALLKAEEDNRGLRGLVYLIDQIQDDAAAMLGEEEVFGLAAEDGEKTLSIECIKNGKKMSLTPKADTTLGQLQEWQEGRSWVQLFDSVSIIADGEIYCTIEA